MGIVGLRLAALSTVSDSSSKRNRAHEGGSSQMRWLDHPCADKQKASAVPDKVVAHCSSLLSFWFGRFFFFRFHWSWPLILIQVLVLAPSHAKLGLTSVDCMSSSD